MGAYRGSIFAFLFFVVLHGWSLYSALADVHYYDFYLRETNYTKLCSTKSILTVNGGFPGPEIQVHKGDTVFVTVHNRGTYGVTIHWHGVKQPRNPWSDGPENVTQCPIQPGKTFTQEIALSDEEGTLWWHAHSDWSRATVHGAIIILPKLGSTYPFETPHAQQTIVIGEWYKNDVMEIFENATATGAGFPESDAYTINGEPGMLYNCSNTTAFTMTVEKGKTYMLRIINAAMNEDQFFGIAKHKLKVVGMDAAYLKPFEVDYIMITPGQTMDVLFTANQTPNQYYMETTPFAEAPPAFDSTNTTAILAYKGTYTLPTTPNRPSLPANSNKTAAGNFTTQLKSLGSKAYPITVPKKITRSIFMTVSVNQIYCPNATCGGPNGNRAAASLTNISFATPSIDILQAYYSNLANIYNSTFPDNPPYVYNYTGDVGDNTLYPNVATDVLMIDYGAEVEIVWQGTNVGAAESHPMHLHGYSFYVVGSGDGNFHKTSSPKGYNTIDPPLVNTFGVPKNGWTTIRFKADNPGVWFMHCHFEKHAAWGMATVLIVKNGPTAATSLRSPPRTMPACSKA